MSYEVEGEVEKDEEREDDFCLEVEADAFTDPVAYFVPRNAPVAVSDQKSISLDGLIASAKDRSSYFDPSFSPSLFITEEETFLTSADSSVANGTAADANEDDADYFSAEKFNPSDSFEAMNLSRPMMKSLSSLAFTRPTKIQAAAIPVALRGKDICGAAETGSGKTAAFIIPILERLLYRNERVPQTRVLVLLPTRELAMQCYEVTERLAQFSKVTSALAVGGLSLKAQEAVLRTRPDIVIATPGRLIDHLRNTASFSLDAVEILVLDEADRMLDIGFTEELNEIITKCPKQRQTMLFSATMTDNVQDLVRLSLRSPVKLFVDSISTVASGLTQEFVRIREQHEKDREGVVLALALTAFTKRTIIFFPTKQQAHRMRIIFGLAGLRSAELHGNLNQAQRLHSLDQFKRGSVDFLLCTDIAARGLDIPHVLAVINFAMPADFKTYQHRVGRTARAGNPGTSCSLCGEADRVCMKEAVRNATESKQRSIPLPLIQQCVLAIANMRHDIETIRKVEKEEKEMEVAEMECKKAKNLLEYKDEIKGRARRTWFTKQSKKRRG